MGENKVATILFFCGIGVMITGLILGVAIGIVEEVDVVNGVYRRFEFFPFIFSAIVGFFTGMLFIGLSEIIKLLQPIQLKLISQQSLDQNKATEKHQQELSNDHTEKIDALFPDKQKEIFKTPYDSVCVGVLQYDVADVVKVIDVSGPTAEEVQTKEIIKEVLGWYQQQIK